MKLRSWLVFFMAFPILAASARAEPLDDALAAYEQGHYRQAFEIASLAGQGGDARALELAGVMLWCGERLYGPALPRNRPEALKLLTAAVAQDPQGQLGAARYLVAHAAGGLASETARR